MCARRTTGVLTRPVSMLKDHKLSDGESAIGDEPCAEIERCRGHELVDELHRLACRVSQADDAKACRNVACELLLPAPLHLRLDPHGFVRLDTRNTLPHGS